MTEPATEYFRVRPGGPLEGEIKVSGATKNSGLKQLAAAILAPGVSVFHNMPPVLDATVMIEVMRALGAEVRWTGPESLSVDTGGDLVPEAPYELVTKMRASVNVLGPLLGRCGSARVALPGGDAIGSRR
ncbi:MAG TPA: UDP-N-acetylglucosamine 1-carboxyvinyltransferase, partial [Acidimicrobiia bacterium]|nr:UDP-N-acetylglucosamine 1-carboxyvinyltransferase [Acidimicrobiia bacterium]